MTHRPVVTAILMLVTSVAPGREWRPPPYLDPPDAMKPPAADSPRTVDVRIDPRVELMSIIFRLAGNPEYNQGRFTMYLKAIDERFGPHREHPLFPYVRNLRATRGVSYDAVMSMAAHLKDPEQLEELIPFDAPGIALDARWKPDEGREFLRLARDFAATSDFKGFMAEHSGMHAMIEARMKAMLAEHADFAWFDAFFGGRPTATFTLIPAPVNGGQNYGPRVVYENGQEEFFAMIGVWQFDADGLPVFDARVLPTVIHEFAHSFVNDCVAKHAEALKPAGTVIFPKVEQGMRRQAYGNWRTMINESLVRASVIRYILAHDGRPAADRAIAGEMQRSFLWMPGLVELLGEYEADRAAYPTLDSFMPRVATFFDGVAQRLGQPTDDR